MDKTLQHISVLRVADRPWAAATKPVMHPATSVSRRTLRKKVRGPHACTIVSTLARNRSIVVIAVKHTALKTINIRQSARTGADKSVDTHSVVGHALRHVRRAKSHAPGKRLLSSSYVFHLNSTLLLQQDLCTRFVSCSLRFGG